MRLQKYLSRAGVASRRAAERIIREGRVRVNGHAVSDLGVRVDPERDTVEVDGRRIALPAPVWIALHKPPGYVTTRRDPQGRPTVYDLLPPEQHGLFHVGRLDADSEGLLLLTNEGELANRLIHPRYEVDRLYEVEVDAALGPAEERRLLSGVVLEDGPARARTLERVSSPPAGPVRLRVVVREGRKREVRRMFEAVGHPVRRLVRLRFGPIALAGLPAGSWRRLGEEETEALAALRIDGG